MIAFRRRAIVAMVLGALVMALPAAAAPPRVTVDQGDGIFDQPFSVRLEGVRPRARVTISARLIDDQNQDWIAIGNFRASRAGKVNTGTDTSLGGTYEGVISGGLACTGLPVPPDKIAAYLDDAVSVGGRTSPSLGTKADTVIIIAVSVDGRALPDITVSRRYLASGVTETEVNEGKIRGRYYAPPGGGHGIPVLVLSGSSGGLATTQAALLASRGHPALAIAYFNYKDLKTSLNAIDLEQFSDGAKWLSVKSGVPRVAIFGVSRGTEAAQAVAGYLPEHIAGVVAFVPSPMFHAGIGPDPANWNVAAWALGGLPVPFMPSDRAGRDSDTAKRQGQSWPGYDGTAYFVKAWNNRAAQMLFATPVDRINVPMLLLAGEDDRIWPSALAARQIADRMTKLGKGNLVTVKSYVGVGHGLANVGQANAISGGIMHPVTKGWVALGGGIAGCGASYDAWQTMLGFLDKLAR